MTQIEFDAAPPNRMIQMPQRWEYATDFLKAGIFGDQKKVSEIDTTLAQRGQLGWELVQLTKIEGLKGTRDGWHFVFKRPGK